MDVLLSAIAAFCYALQNVLVSPYYRNLDQYSAVAFRGLSLGITMLPLLLFVPRESFLGLNDAMPFIVAACFCACIGNWTIARSFCHLPVSVATAISMAVSTIVAAVLSVTFGSDLLSLPAIVWIGILIATTFTLAICKSGGTLPERFDPVKGALFSAAFGVFLGIAYFLVGSAARLAHPFLVGYFWEFGIGIIALIVAQTPGLYGRPKFTPVDRRTFIKILLAASPTVIGTGCYAVATNIGSIPIVAALQTLIIFASAIFAWLLFNERPSLRQWLVFAAIVVAVCGVQFAR